MNAGEQRRRLIKKSLSYTLLVLLVLLAQCTMPMLGTWKVRPQILIAMTAVTALFEGPRMGGIFGAVCGTLCDWLSVHTGAYYTIMLMLFGTALGVLVEYSMRRNLLSAFFVTIITIVPVQLIFFTLFLLLPGIAPLYALVTVTTPETLYTLALLPFIYLPARLISRRYALNSKNG